MKSCRETWVSVPPGEAGQVVGDSGEPQDARPALPGTLSGQIASNAGSFRYSAGVLAEDSDHSDASGGADGAAVGRRRKAS